MGLQAPRRVRNDTGASSLRLKCVCVCECVCMGGSQRRWSASAGPPWLSREIGSTATYRGATTCVCVCVCVILWGDGLELSPKGPGVCMSLVAMSCRSHRQPLWGPCCLAKARRLPVRGGTGPHCRSQSFVLSRSSAYPCRALPLLRKGRRPETEAQQGNLEGAGTGPICRSRLSSYIHTPIPSPSSVVIAWHVGGAGLPQGPRG